MESINTTQNTEQQPTTPTPEASGAQGEKLFTQAELDRIIGERLSCERAKGEPTAIDERENTLRAREARLDCRDYLEELSKGGKAAGGVMGLLDILDTGDSEKFKKTVSALLELGAFNPQLEPLKIPPVDIRGGASPDDLIAAAFKPKS